MKNIFIALVITLLAAIGLDAQWETKGDTIIVQTLSYDSITTRSGTWQFPPADSYEKILMHYSLKCDPRTTRDGFDCGEWDYLTYTVVTDSSGMFDSTSFAAPNFLVRGTNPNKYYYTTEPYSYKEQETIYNTSFGNNLTNKIEVPFNNDENGVFEITPTDGKAFFVNMLFNNSELKSYRTEQGEIHSVKLKFLKEVKINNFRIKLSNIAEALPGDVLATEADSYLGDIDVKAGETKEFVLFSPFNLQEENYLSIVISGEIEEGILSLQARDDEESLKSNYYFGSENYIKFSKGSYIDVPKTAFADIDDEITIAFWQNGDRILMPQNSYAFEGVNSQGQRVVNSHLPWSNGQVYWDAGNAGGSYDRISKQATDPQFKGQWNHWAFTKNTTTGDMKIYLNGVEWHTGTALTRGFDKIEIFKIASSAKGFGVYDGSMDNFAVWNRVLSSQEIENSMKNDFKTSKGQQHWDGLLFYYDMNNIVDNNIPDVTGNGNDGTAHGFPEVRSISSESTIVSDNNNPKLRPVVTFVKGEFSGSVELQKNTENVVREYPVPHDEVYLFDYDSPNKVIPAEELKSFSDKIKVPTEVLTVYPANKAFYTYGEFGSVIDSVIAQPTDSLVKDEIKYYSPVVDYEIHRFITPYGINLDLGPDGFTWIEDVTDFEPLLRDYVKLRAGNQQELIDLKFLFIKGTPARNVRSVQTLWSSGGSYESIVNDNNISSLEITPNKDALMFKAITRSSGHGFAGPANTDNCSEFCKRTHRLYVGEEGLFEWEGWKECGDNPVFPQGGTWQIDRSDWCPGATVNTYGHELGNMVTPGETVPIDYEIDNPSQFVPYGNYVFTGYMIGYGDPNFVNDVSLERIISPSLDQEYGRLNPACGDPQVIIKNTGSEILRKLTFEYGIKGREKKRHHWGGRLEFLETEIVTLPAIHMNTLNSGKEYEFEVKVINPNEKKDEYPKNDYAISKFIGVDTYGSEITINLKTNNQAEAQYRMTLKKAYGPIIEQVELGDFESNKPYSFTHTLSKGCYELLFENVEGFGLDLWWMRDQLGTGYISFTSGNKTKNFNPDFGNFIKYQFSVGDQPEVKLSTDTLNFGDVVVGEKREKSIFIRPRNPKGLNLKSVEMGFAGSKGITLISPTDFSNDIYIADGEQQEIKFQFEPKDDKPVKTSILIKTDGENDPSFRLALLGNTGISSVRNEFDNRYSAEIVNNGDGKELKIINNNNAVLPTSVELFDINGKSVSMLYENLNFTNSISLPLNVTSLVSGIYIVRITAGNNHKDLKFIHIK
jgi:hypothetical protein